MENFTDIKLIYNHLEKMPFPIDTLMKLQIYL